MKRPPLDLTIINKAMARVEKQARRTAVIGTIFAVAAAAIALTLSANGVVVALVTIEAGALGGWLAIRRSRRNGTR